MTLISKSIRNDTSFGETPCPCYIFKNVNTFFLLYMKQFEHHSPAFIQNSFSRCLAFIFFFNDLRLFLTRKKLKISIFTINLTLFTGKIKLIGEYHVEPDTFLSV